MDMKYFNDTLLNNKKNIITQSKINIIRFASLFLLLLILLTVTSNTAHAWGTSHPANSEWVTQKTVNFQWDYSPYYGQRAYQLEVYNNSTKIYTISTTYTTATNVSINLTSLTQSATDKSYWRVNILKYDGLDACGNIIGEAWTGWSGNAYFGVDLEAPAVGTKSAPSNNAYVKNPVNIKWNGGTDSMSGVKEYRIRMDEATDYLVTTTNKSFTLTEGWHKYRIYIRDNCYGNSKTIDSSTHWESQYSSPEQLTNFYVDDTKPTPGTKTQPSNDYAINPYGGAGQTDASFNDYTSPMVNYGAAGHPVIFKWTAASDSGSGIDYYNFYCTPAYSTTSIGNVTQIEKALNPGVYKWNLTAFDKAGNFADYTPEFKLTIDRTKPNVGSKTAPIQDFCTNNAKINFSWSAASDNDQIWIYNSYLVNLPSGVDSAAYGGAVYSGASTSFQYTVPAEGRYQWNLRCYDRARNYTWYFDDWKFIYDKTAPKAGNKVFPTWSATDPTWSTNQTSITFQWTAANDQAPNASIVPSGVDRYDLIIDQGTGSERVIPCGTSLSKLVTNISEGLHTWTVKAYDKAGNFVFYNPAWPFIVDLTKPIAGNKIKPVNNFKTNSTSITFQWGDSADTGAAPSGIDHVDLIVTGPISFTESNVKVNSGSGVAGTFTRDNLVDGDYYWNIKVYDRAGNFSEYDGGAKWKFTIDRTPPSVGSKTSPADKYITKNNILKFQWTAATDNVSSAAGLKYCIIFDSAPLPAAASAGTIASSGYTNPSPFADGKHKWNIRVFDEAGNFSDYGGTWEFLVDTIPPISGKLYGIRDDHNLWLGSGWDIDSGVPKFIWQPTTDPGYPDTGSGIDMYKLVVEIPRGTSKYNSDYIISSVPSDESPNLSYKVPETSRFADDGPYYWTIWVRDVAGNETKYTQQWNFYVDSSMAFDFSTYNLLVSKSKTVPSKTGPALYEPAPNYEINIIQPNKISFGPTDTGYPAAGLVPADPDPVGGIYGTSFYWTVRNQDISGLWGKYEDYSVNIVTLVPGELKEPLNDSLSPTKPKFVWTDSMPKEVRRQYRLVVYKDTWATGTKVLEYKSDVASDGNGLPTNYTSLSALADGTYYWSVFATDDRTPAMLNVGETNETQYTNNSNIWKPSIPDKAVWKFSVDRKPRVTMASSDDIWYAGYAHALTVDSFGADGYATLGTCEVTLYEDAAGTKPIRKVRVYNISSDPDILILDSDTNARLENSKLYSTFSNIVPVDPNFPSNKRFVINLAPHYNFVDKYTSGKIYARARVYYKNQANLADCSIYADYPATGQAPAYVGKVVNSLKFRPYDSAATDDTKSVFFLTGVANSFNSINTNPYERKETYTIIKPGGANPPTTLQYLNKEVGFEKTTYLYINGEVYYDSAQAASTPLSSADAIKDFNAAGEQMVWRITKYPNTYNASMRLKLFKKSDYVPANTFDFAKVLSEFNGTNPVEVITAPADYINGSLTTLKNAWSEPEMTHYIDRTENAGNENTLTKFETWFYMNRNQAVTFKYSADMCGQVWFNGEALEDKYNIYNPSESQHKPPVDVLLSCLEGWNHLVIYVLHQKSVTTNGLNGVAYKLDGINKPSAFSGKFSTYLWRSYPVPQPNLSDFENNGRGTSIYVYNQNKNTSGAVIDTMAVSLSGAPAIEKNHKGIFIADQATSYKLAFQKPSFGGDNKISLKIYSNEYLNAAELRASTTDNGGAGYITIHVNQTPEVPDTVQPIANSPVIVCEGAYKDVESLGTNAISFKVKNSEIVDQDNPAFSNGFHHSTYTSQIRTDEVRYIYALWENASETTAVENFYELDYTKLKYIYPANVYGMSFSSFPASPYTPPSNLISEARNFGGVISPIYTYRAWVLDEHGEIQKLGSTSRRFCLDIRPPVVADIQVFYDKEGVRLDNDISPYVNDKVPQGTNPIALAGHTLTLWAYCTDEITANPKNFKDGSFYIRRSNSTDNWVEVPATCEVDTAISYEDPRFQFERTPAAHPNGYIWYGYYTIPYDSDLTYYDVDFQVSDAVGNRSPKMSSSGTVEISSLTKQQFKVATIGIKPVTVAPTARSKSITVSWIPFENWRNNDKSIDHYIVSVGDLTPNPYETNNWVDGILSICTREVRVEGKLPVFVQPVEKINTVGFSTALNDFIYSFEEPGSVVNRRDGWREDVSCGGYFSADLQSIKDGMYSWSTLASSNLDGKYSLYKDYNIGPNVMASFGAWIKKNNASQEFKMQAICYDISNNVVGTFSNSYNFNTNAWVHYYLKSNVEQKPYFMTPNATARVRLKITSDTALDAYADNVGFGAYGEVTVDFTPPQKPDIKIGVVDNHINTGNSATIYGYWDGQWDIKGSAWLDEPTNFPTLNLSNLVNFNAVTDKKKVGMYSYRIDNGTKETAVGYFNNADIKLNVESGDVLRIWAYLNNYEVGVTQRKIENLGIAISDGTSWSSRVYFGNDAVKANKGFVDKGFGNYPIINLGALPDANQWVPLDIKVTDIGMEGRQIAGIAFSIDGTTETAVSSYDTVSVYVDFIDVDSGAGVKNYLPQLEVNRDVMKTTFQDFSSLKLADGTIHSGFMTSAVFDDTEFVALNKATNEMAFTGKYSAKVSAMENGISYNRTGLTARELSSTSKISLSPKLSLEWPASESEFEYNGGALVIWAYVKNNLDTSRDSLSEINVGVEYSTNAQPKMLTIAKYRTASLSPKSQRPPEFEYLKTSDTLSSDEVKATANLEPLNSLYQLSDSFETMLTGNLSFHNNFIDAGKVPGANNEWSPLVIPIKSLVPDKVIAANEKVKVKRLIIETANCDIYVDHIGKVDPFKQLGDWQGNLEKKIFNQDFSTFSFDELHNAEQSIDGTESIKFKRAGIGERNYYMRLNPLTPDDLITPEDESFDPVPYRLNVPASGGVISLNLYLGTNEANLPDEILLEFHKAGDALNEFHHRAFWGLSYIKIAGVTRNDIPEHYYIGTLPEVRGGWVEMLIPSDMIGLTNLSSNLSASIDGINIRAYSNKTSGFEFWIDRIGLLGTVPHNGENKCHSVYVWDMDDYTFYTMRIKAWDWVLNESNYSYSKYVRSKDRTPPVISTVMSPRINTEGLDLTKDKHVLDSIYYIKDNAGLTSEVPLFKDPATGNYLSDSEIKNRAVDLSVTTDDYISFETLNASKVVDNKLSAGQKQLHNGNTVEILLSVATAYDPLPSAEYINSEWLTDIQGKGTVPTYNLELNDTSNVWLTDPFKRYSKIKYYFIGKNNYIAKQIVYDDESNFVSGGDTYIDVTPGPISKIAVYHPASDSTSSVEIRATDGALIDSLHKDRIKEDTKAWIGVTAYDSQGNPVLKGKKLKWRWNGYYKSLVSGKTYDLNVDAAETQRRMTIVPGAGSISYLPSRPFRITYDPPPRPYFQIQRPLNTDSVELASKLLTPEQLASPELDYSTQEVEISTYTGYNINGEGYSVNLLSSNPNNKLGRALLSGDSEAYFVTTTHAGDILWATITTDDGKVFAQTAKFRVTSGGVSELKVEPEYAEIDAEGGQAMFNIKGFDSLKSKTKYPLKYHSDTEYLTNYLMESELYTYEYISTNEIAVNPVWTLDSHEAQIKDNDYMITNADTVGTFVSSGRTSINTFAAGWEEGTHSIYVIDTTDVLFTDGTSLAMNYMGGQILTSGAQVAYGIQSPPNGKGWELSRTDIFVKAVATVVIKPILKGYLSFMNSDSEAVQVLNMNSVINNSDLTDALKFYVQTFNTHDRPSAYESNTEVIVKVDTSENEFVRLYRWPITNIEDGVTELKVNLNKGSAEVGLVAYDAKFKPKISLFSKNPNYKDILSPELRSKATVNIFPNKLDHIYFEPSIAKSDMAERYSIIKERSHPFKAYGYDFHNNMVPLDYQTAGLKWSATAGEIKEENDAGNHLHAVFSSKGISPGAGGTPVDITVNGTSKFKKISSPKGTAIRDTGIDVNLAGKGYVKVVNFGLFQFPCIYQELDRNKLDKDGEYELSFLYMTGDSDGDNRLAAPRIGIAYWRDSSQTTITSDDIQLLYSQPLTTGGKWSTRTMKLRFKVDGSAVSETGKPNVNNLDGAQKIFLFLGAPATNDDRPAIRYDHVTIDRVN